MRVGSVIFAGFGVVVMVFCFVIVQIVIMCFVGLCIVSSVGFLGAVPA